MKEEFPVPLFFFGRFRAYEHRCSFFCSRNTKAQRIFPILYLYGLSFF